MKTNSLGPSAPVAAAGEAPVAPGMPPKDAGSRRRTSTDMLLKNLNVTPIMLEILECIGRPAPVCPALMDFADALTGDLRNARRKRVVYKWLAMGVLLATPLVGIALAYAAVLNEFVGVWVILALSIASTLLTVINSSFNLRERFIKSCSLEIRVHSLAVDFLTDLQGMATHRETEAHLAHRYRKRLLGVEEDLMSLFLPVDVPPPGVQLPAGKA